MHAALLYSILYHHLNKLGLLQRLREVVKMDTFSVNSLLEELEKLEDYGAMADLSQENISMLFSKQLRGLPLK